jgi:hypothetical protein
MDDQQVITQQRRNFEMTHKRTSHGNAKRPPSLTASEQDIEEWHGAIASALDVARRVEQNERDLASTTATDPRRFPAIDAGGRA